MYVYKKIMEQYFDKTNPLYSNIINSFRDLEKNVQERIIHRVEEIKQNIGKEVFISHILKNTSGINVLFCCGELFC
jgi:hypothetical protein